MKLRFPRLTKSAKLQLWFAAVASKHNKLVGAMLVAPICWLLFQYGWHGTPPPLLTIVALSGVVLAYYMYMVNPALPAAIRRNLNPVYQLLENKYYLDWFNENVLARGMRQLGTLLWKVGDQKLIDGVLVNGSWKLVGWISGMVRRLQSGYIYHYAFGMIIGVFVLMTYFVWLNR